MNAEQYFSWWQQQIKEQNRTFNPDYNWSVNGSETIFNKEDLQKHRRQWQDFAIGYDQGIKTAFFILIYNNSNKQWLTECIESCLWQTADFPFQNHIVVVVDPPANGTPSILFDLEVRYGHLSKFVVEYNKNRLGWCGSYNRALDICKELGIDFAIVSDSDDINHPERLYWSYHLLNKNKLMKCVTFIPANFNDGEQWLNTCVANDWHPPIFDDYVQPFVDGCILTNPNTGQPCFNYNPNVITITKDVIENVRFRPKIVENDRNITPADQAFIYEIMAKYPLKLIANDRLMQIYRYHTGNKTKGIPPENWRNACFWRQEIAKEVRKKLVEQGGDRIVNEIIDYYWKKYEIELKKDLFYAF